MEMSILEKIRRPQLLKTGRVLEVRAWSPATMIEIDLHLPFVDMHQWQEIPYIKFRVGPLSYRDYTPTEWDAVTSTCTLFINTAHTGPGSLWARGLSRNYAVQYIKTGSTHQGITAMPSMVALGDESSIGHLLALEQMAKTHFSGAVLIDDIQHRNFFSKGINSLIQPIARSETFGHQSLMRWINTQQYELHNTAFYLTGNNIMVSQLRKLLKQQGCSSANIKSQGFWQ